MLFEILFDGDSVPDYESLEEAFLSLEDFGITRAMLEDMYVGEEIDTELCVVTRVS